MPANTTTSGYMTASQDPLPLEIDVRADKSFELYLHLPLGSTPRLQSLRVVKSNGTVDLFWNAADLTPVRLAPTTYGGIMRERHKITANFDDATPTGLFEVVQLEVSERVPVKVGKFDRTDGDGELFLGFDSVQFVYDVTISTIHVDSHSPSSTDPADDSEATEKLADDPKATPIPLG